MRSGAGVSLPSLGLLDLRDKALEGVSELGFEEVALGGEVIHVNELSLELFFLIAKYLQVVLLAILPNPQRYSLRLLLEDKIANLP